MKKIVSIAVAVFSITVSADGGDYCRGFAVGYRSGYCKAQNNPYCVAPPAVCDYAGFSYSQGVASGFERGFSDGR